MKKLLIGFLSIAIAALVAGVGFVVMVAGILDGCKGVDSMGIIPAALLIAAVGILAECLICKNWSLIVPNFIAGLAVPTVCLSSVLFASAVDITGVVGFVAFPVVIGVTVVIKSRMKKHEARPSPE